MTFLMRPLGLHSQRLLRARRLAATASSTDLQQVEAAQRARASRTIPETTRIAGVSFGRRQQVVHTLQQLQAVQCVRQQSNEADPDAVSVLTLAGDDIGFVPRELTGRFLTPPWFGRVRSCGPALESDPQMWGVQVALQPDLSQLGLTPFPAALSAAAELPTLLADSEQAQLAQSISQQCNGRCQITGLQAEQLQLFSQWEEDDLTRTYVLRGLSMVLPVLAQTSQLQLGAAPPGAEQAAAVLSAANLWSMNEAHTYLRYIEEVAAQRASVQAPEMEWRLDLQWLAEQRLAIPGRLRPLRRHE